jgi:Zinc finger, C3HC4 type (RING finger)
LKIGDYLKIGSTVFQVESSDIHNLKNMPVINRRVQGQGQNVQANPNSQDLGSNDNFESSGSDMMVDDEEHKDALQMEEDGQKGDKNQGSETCKVCYSADADAAFIPCGHVTACIRCA